MVRVGLTRGQAMAAAAIGVSALAIGMYLSALRGGFVWDDFGLADGTAIGGGRSFGACFTTAFLDHYYRPLVSACFYMDRMLWPDNATAYHLVNVLLHALTTTVVIGAVYAAYDRRSIAVAAGLLYAAHPAHVGAVAWIGGRTDVLGALWTAAFAWGLISAAKSVGDRRSAMMAVAVAAYAAAVFTKEQSLALLPMAPLAFACFRPARGVALPGAGWFALGPFVVVAAFYLSMGAFLGMPSPPGLWVPVDEHLLRVGQTIAGYAILLVFPNQTLMHTFSLDGLASAMPWS
ncbi:MAG: hypothetical protein FJX72_03665, partial [Armatimonadetes bacterium]|nr:hypothetical protein [Armatimonadota bacterium]